MDRPSSPVPSPSFRDRDKFCHLDLHQQLGYTKEVLQAVLNHSYSPVQSRHERFMKGGKERAALDKDASLKGVMTSKEVSKLTKLLIRWVLRDLVETERASEECEVCVPSGCQVRLLTPRLGGRGTGCGYGARRGYGTNSYRGSRPSFRTSSFLIYWLSGF